MEKVTITGDVATVLKNTLQQGNFTNVAVLVDENTHRHCYPLLRDHLPEHTLVQIKSGEIHKNIETCVSIWSVLTQQSFDRKGIMINLGGGVIGDMGGFCARTYKRGISFINVPTTLLAQVDASAGGKLGIDFEHFKNHIGLFSEPDQVIIDPVFLQTLSARELRSGYAEVIKHNLIADKAGWEKIKNTPFEQLDWKAIIQHSVKLKQNVTDQDPTEKGIRKILNFGHTIGHAVESFLMQRNRAILHGEAVAVGMIAEAQASYALGFINAASLEEITSYILSIFEKVLLSSEDIQTICEYAVQDKKNKSNRILAALLKEVGNASWDIEISPAEIDQSLKYYVAQT